MLVPSAAQHVACSGIDAAGDAGSTPATKRLPDAYTIDNIRDFVVGIDEPIELEDGTTRTQICFDNAATTPALVPVLDEVVDKLALYGSIGRGFSQKSDISSDIYEETRGKVLSFLGADAETYTCFSTQTTPRTA